MTCLLQVLFQPMHWTGSREAQPREILGVHWGTTRTRSLKWSTRNGKNTWSTWKSYLLLLQIGLPAKTSEGRTCFRSHQLPGKTTKNFVSVVQREISINGLPPKLSKETSSFMNSIPWISPRILFLIQGKGSRDLNNWTLDIRSMFGPSAKPRLTQSNKDIYTICKCLHKRNFTSFVF